MKKQVMYLVTVAACLTAISLSQTEKSAGAWFQSGKEKTSAKDYHGAIDDYTMAIQLKPDYAKAYYSRGRAYLKLSRKGKQGSDIFKVRARKDFMKAMELGFHVDMKYLDECD